MAQPPSSLGSLWSTRSKVPTAVQEIAGHVIALSAANVLLRVMFILYRVNNINMMHMMHMMRMIED